MRRSLVKAGSRKLLDRLVASGEPIDVAKAHVGRILRCNENPVQIGSGPTDDERIAAYEAAVAGYVTGGMTLAEANRQAFYVAGRWRGRRQRCQTPGDVCLACGTTENLEPDHVIPRSNGGWDTPSNLQTLCRRCNTAKGLRETDYRCGTPADNVTSIGNRRAG